MQWYVALLSRLNHHGSIPRCEDRSDYNSINAELLLALEIQTTISLLLKESLDEEPSPALPADGLCW